MLKTQELEFIQAGSWIAVKNDRYELVLSGGDMSPWLLDLQNDPDECLNFIHDPEYYEITSLLAAELAQRFCGKDSISVRQLEKLSRFLPEQLTGTPHIHLFLDCKQTG